MFENILGAVANLTSLILWLPQAKTTWKNQNNVSALNGVSIGTQIIVAINTILWCVYGIMIKNFWLPLGTLIILPLACFTILIKCKRKDENKNITNENQLKWFKFEHFQRLSDESKKSCLKAIYTTDFKNQLIMEFLNWESFERMSELDKMYWDSGLWEKNEKNL